MAFWGVEVRPGRPYTIPPSVNRSLLLSSSNASSALRGRGTTRRWRLRITKAAIRVDDSFDNILTPNDIGRRTILQCNVGNRRPILICSLLPNKFESCCLELEFEEEEEVVFSVIGPRSISLVGYYVSKGHFPTEDADGDEIFSSEDIGNTDSDDSVSNDQDRYESDFIDDEDDINGAHFGNAADDPPARKQHSSLLSESEDDEEYANAFFNVSSTSSKKKEASKEVCKAATKGKGASRSAAIERVLMDKMVESRKRKRMRLGRHS